MRSISDCFVFFTDLLCLAFIGKPAITVDSLLNLSIPVFMDFVVKDESQI